MFHFRFAEFKIYETERRETRNRYTKKVVQRTLPFCDLIKMLKNRMRYLFFL